jgi:16S rRNA C1402 N4-methylase RsmH
LGHDLSIDVKEFIAEHVQSVLELEVLLLLNQNRDNSWTSESVGGALHLSVKSAKAVLDELVSNGFLICIDGATEHLYRYNRPSEEFDKRLSQLANAYATQRVAVLTHIFANQVDKVRLFTETFRMIKGDDR